MLSQHCATTTNDVYGSGGSGSITAGPGGGISFGGGEPFPGYSILVAGITNYEVARNVRCLATGNLRDVTSHSDAIDRLLAAEQVYRLLSTFKAFWAYWSGKDPLNRDKYFKLIYADGGSEIWPIVSPTQTTVTGGQPIGGTLEKGDGKIHRHTVCG